jgi:hypothetical protein
MVCLGVKMANASYSSETVANYLKSGYTIESENEDVAILVKRRKVGVFWNLVLSVITGGFWLLIWMLRIIFKNSVVKLYKGEIPEKNPGVVSKLSDLGADKFQNLTARGKLIAGGAVVLIIAIFLISSSVAKTNSEAEAKNALYGTHQATLETKVDSASCDALQNVLETGSSVNFTKKYLGKVAKIAKSLTPWTAGAYLAKSDWIVPAETLMLEFENEQEVITNKILKNRLNELDDKSAAIGISQLNDSWGDSFRLFVVDNCKLGDIAAESKGSIVEVATAASVIQAKASSKPWYPKGFEEVSGFPGFAYLNISNQGCSYSFGTCAKFKIVSQTGCPDSLYVETNAESNGEVLDWSNDTARGLRANQIAVMETNFSTDRAGSWGIVKISCY